MTIKRYLAKDMNEAMTRIKYELGSNAVIISSRWIRKKGIRNLFRRKILEVTAAVDHKYVPSQPSAASSHYSVTTGHQPSALQHSAATGQAASQLSASRPSTATHPPVSTEHPASTQSGASMQSAASQPVVSQSPISTQAAIQNDKELQLEKEIKELREMVGILLEKEKARQRGGRKIQFSTVMQRHLKKMDLDEQITKEFREFCRKQGSSKIDYNRANQYFKELLEKSIDSKEGIKSKIWAFIGPTGVGKTTTIAKIAAKETLENRKKVGLITMDTYRIGAVEQLKTYADILSLPLEVVSSKEEVVQALEKLEDCDLILIDSTGRSSQMKDQLLETKEYLSGVNQKHNILVMSATTRSIDLKLILENYKLIGYDSIILTKLDETQCYGSILNINHYTDKPLCYLTTGQIVPEDIKKVTMENLLEYIFMGVSD